MLLKATLKSASSYRLVWYQLQLQCRLATDPRWFMLMTIFRNYHVEYIRFFFNQTKNITVWYVICGDFVLTGDSTVSRRGGIYCYWRSALKLSKKYHLSAVYRNMPMPNFQKSIWIHTSDIAYVYVAINEELWDHVLTQNQRNYHKLFLKWVLESTIWLTHWGRVTHICVANLTIIGSDNGLSPGRRQAIT